MAKRADAHARRGRRGQLRRLSEGVPRAGRPGPAARALGHPERPASTALQNATGATSGGYVAQRRLGVRGARRGWLTGPKDLENTMVKVRNGTPVLVSNVARVVEGYVPLRGTVGRGMATDSVEGTILLRRGENPRDVLDGIHHAVSADQRRRPAQGHAHRALLRPHPARRHHAAHRLAQHDRGRAAGAAGHLALPARDLRLDRGGDHHTAGACSRASSASPTRACRRTCSRSARSTSASLLWGARDPGRERLPPPRPPPARAEGRARGGGARLGRGGAADPLLASRSSSARCCPSSLSSGWRAASSARWRSPTPSPWWGRCSSPSPPCRRSPPCC